MRFSVVAVLISVLLHVGCASEPRQHSRTTTAPAPVSAPAAAPPALEVSAAPPLPTVSPTPPLPAASASSVPSSSTPLPPAEPRTLDCRCDILDFESDGPPKGRCTWVQAADGTGSWTGETSRPKFSAKLTPIVRAGGGEPRAVDYTFEGEFDFACKQRWCGRKQHKVLRVRENDFRVTVDRSDEGPPRRVLWFTCTP